MNENTYYVEISANGVGHKHYIECQEDLVILSELFKKIERNAKSFVEQKADTSTEEHF